MKPVDPKDRTTGINFASAREWLKDLPARRLDSDWLAVDREGHVAFFAGNDRGAIPENADRARVSEALDALARAASVLHGIGEVDVPEGYRRADDGAREALFDAPVTALGEPAHEPPVDGYPLLVVGTLPGLRERAAEWQGRDASARDGFAIIFPSLTPAEHQQLHWTDLCQGCRVLDDPSDRRPCAPEVLAAAGLYVYAHTSDDEADPYRRVAGPSVAADLVDLEQVVQLVASCVKLDVSFEDEESIHPRDLLPCAP